jgi:hypothetical protein
MTYEQIKKLSDKEFKRFCGVQPQLFEEMANVLRQKVPESKNRGAQPKLRVEEQLLIALEYWREYRTYFHIAHSWGVHESTVCRTVHRVEDELIKSGKFNLPGNIALADAETEWSAVIIDVGESPIERPKKNSNVTTAGKKRDIL